MDHRFGLGQRAIPGGENINFCGNQEVGSGKYLKGTQKNRGKVFGNDGAAQLLGTPPTTLVSRMKKFPAKGGANEQ
jgi:hypothetical protein